MIKITGPHPADEADIKAPDGYYYKATHIDVETPTEGSFTENRHPRYVWFYITWENKHA